ncbi:unnamed protein product, partial [Vitis vinifera]
MQPAKSHYHSVFRFTASTKKAMENTKAMEANTMVCVRGFVLVLLLFLSPANAIRSFPSKVRDGVGESGIKSHVGLQFAEAPEYRNGPQCPISSGKEGLVSVCDPVLVHIAMTLDVEYLRGSVAAVHSVLRHASCPDNIFFHFIASDSNSMNPDDLLMKSTYSL